jgi:hypothetical protein
MITAIVLGSMILLPVADQQATSMVNGRDLYEWCTSPAGSSEDLFCSLYITGFVNGASISRGGTHAGAICLPPDFTGADGRNYFIRVSKARLEKRPSTLDDESVDSAVGAALSATFPCK